MPELSSHKQWAAENLKGVKNVLLPSFRPPDLTELDEKGIRWDVRHSIDQGFHSTMCEPTPNLNLDEARRFVDIATNEAGDDIRVSLYIQGNSLGENRKLMEYAEDVGVNTVLLGYPYTWDPDSPKEIYEVTKDFCDLVDLPIILYPSPKFNVEQFHPSGFPVNILDRMADIDNAVGAKISSSGADNFLVADEIFRRVGDRLQVSYPGGEIPGLVRNCDMQWLAAGPVDVYQTPDNPYYVEFFDLLRKGNYNEAMEVYWKLGPLRKAMGQLAKAGKKLGNYNYAEMKYWKWLTGGNGGYLRQPAMEISNSRRRTIRWAMKEVGLEVREDDSEFYVGRVNYKE